MKKVFVFMEHLIQQDFRCGSPLRQSPASALPPMAEADEDGDMVDKLDAARNADDLSGVNAESEMVSESGERSPSPLPAPAVKPECFEEDFYPMNPGMSYESPNLLQQF